jgi:hypothetical protein
MIKKCFLDTCVIKFGITSVTRLVPRNNNILWNGKIVKSRSCKIADVSLYDKIKDKYLLDEIKLLPKVADLGKDGRIEFCNHAENNIELLCLPKTWGRKKTCFEGMKIGKVSSPVSYDRLLGSLYITPEEAQFQFLQSIKDERFQFLQRKTGAYQGENGFNRNQLLDAFYIWCAEYSNCDFYLTLDFKLINCFKNQAEGVIKTRILSPSELLSECKVDSVKLNVASRV